MTFKFKQFSVSQAQSAMKIGTDNVLLGAWTPIDNFPQNILDVGAGTGILALMLAQRTQAEIIDAVEIDEKAYIECTENFEDSPWADRLFCYFASFQEFVAEMQDEKYDLIVSNPPFYTSDYQTDSKSRNKARFENSLPFKTLIEGVASLLSDEGVFSVIVPFAEEENFVQLASEKGLFPRKITRVKGNANAEVKRSLIAFDRKSEVCIFDLLIIEKERNIYTDSYTELTKDFYLKM
ncbi:tRNA1(Val) (adenine(37)-N6)-methyltransferase [Capnocytophaga felis]|uniref:tRNA1(Val) (adenine(37)-N6)-methyltransferase n=1 Tax=Capnocytophaga felis TaxID=2267611 RepID=A0A5M4B8L6_9FLAO|nr:methyltransferase [Capnocytophaga felis]GET45908.1 tRNA1(Val) (adenine(37)-N6)-methyltransferase [Capnocytophaga felis]GET49239.1 tRNA1(Val) (adenine(37)-N6)-methyltransferase [Capnocytophaga felis]